MTDDVTSDSSTGNSSTASPDVASATTPASASTQTTTQPSTEATTATPAGEQANGDGSFTANTRNTQTQPNQATIPGQAPSLPAAAPVNYEKRYNDQVQYLNRLARENADHRKYRDSWGDLNPQQVRELIQKQQTDAQSRSLKPWQPQHPDYSASSDRISRAKNYRAAREELVSDPTIDDATKSRALGRIAQRMGVGQADVDLLQDYERHQQDFSDRLARDPESAIGDIVERRVQSRLEQYDAFRRTSAATEQWINDPAKSQLLEKHAEAVLWAMDDNTPRRDVGITIAKLKAENEQLRGRLGGQREVTETAAAQTAALRKRSTVTRDSISTPRTGDPVEEGQKLGLHGPDLLAHLRSKRAANDA